MTSSLLKSISDAHIEPPVHRWEAPHTRMDLGSRDFSFNTLRADDVMIAFQGRVDGEFQNMNRCSLLLGSFIISRANKASWEQALSGHKYHRNRLYLASLLYNRGFWHCYNNSDDLGLRHELMLLTRRWHGSTFRTRKVTVYLGSYGLNTVQQELLMICFILPLPMAGPTLWWIGSSDHWGSPVVRECGERAEGWVGGVEVRTCDGSNGFSGGFVKA